MKMWIGAVLIGAALALAGLGLREADDQGISESGDQLLWFGVIVAAIALLRLGWDLMKADREQPAAPPPQPPTDA
jgi:cytochrome b561